MQLDLDDKALACQTVSSTSLQSAGKCQIYATVIVHHINGFDRSLSIEIVTRLLLLLDSLKLLNVLAWACYLNWLTIFYHKTRFKTRKWVIWFDACTTYILFQLSLAVSLLCIQREHLFLSICADNASLTPPLSLSLSLSLSHAHTWCNHTCTSTHKRIFMHLSKCMHTRVIYAGTHTNMHLILNILVRWLKGKSNSSQQRELLATQRFKRYHTVSRTGYCCRCNRQEETWQSCLCGICIFRIWSPGRQVYTTIALA